MLHELDGFTYATALDLNMGTTSLDWILTRPDTAPSFFHGVNTHKRLPMGIAGSPDIFQSKMLELMLALELVQTYLDDLIVITKASL